MRTLVTGATGFIGGAVVQNLLSLETEVAALVRTPHIEEFQKKFPQIVVLEGSLENPPWSRIEAFAPEACLHIAWIATPGVYLHSSLNQLYLELSLAFCRELVRRGLRRLMVLGTCLEYAASLEPLHATTSTIDPQSAYARAKDSLRQHLESTEEYKDLIVSWGRVFYPYGPGEHPDRICSVFARQLSKGLLQLKTPQCIKDFIHIEDLASAITCVLRSPHSGPINLATGTGYSIQEVASLIGHCLGDQGRIECTNPPQFDPHPCLIADISPLLVLGWKQHISLEEGLRSFIHNRQGLPPS